MDRICDTLATAGYLVTMVGREKANSLPIVPKKYVQKRLRCLFSKGQLFYAEFNIRLLFHLLFKRMDAICCVDLDTILPALIISVVKKVQRIYDAHELFCEMKEVVSRPPVYKIWKRIEHFCVPRFVYGYTVSEPISLEFQRMYGVKYEQILNVPRLDPNILPPGKQQYILYQGAVNEGRSFETLIPAMRNIPAILVICGDGNFMQKAKQLVEDNNLKEKVTFTGMLRPEELKTYTHDAKIGLTLFENMGQSNYFSLANRFFDYIHAGIPQLCVGYPAYRKINTHFCVALLIDDLSPEVISMSLNNLLANNVLYSAMQAACFQAREVYNWQEEEKKLLSFYRRIFA